MSLCSSGRQKNLHRVLVVEREGEIRAVDLQPGHVPQYVGALRVFSGAAREWPRCAVTRAGGADSDCHDGVPISVLF